MLDPAFRELKFAGLFPEDAGAVFHVLDVGVHPLTDVEPFFLALVAVQAGALDVHLGLDVHVEIRFHRTAELIGDAVRHTMVNLHILISRLCRGGAFHVDHAATEGGSNRQTAGIDVVFHVVVGTLRQNDFGLDFADHGNQFREVLVIVEHLDVVADAFVEDSAHRFGRGQRFFPAHTHDFLIGMMIRAERAVRDVHVMNFITGIFQQHHRTHHAELKIVRMTGNGKSSFAHDQCISTSQTPKPPR